MSRLCVGLLMACGGSTPEDPPTEGPWFEDSSATSGLDVVHAPRTALDGTSLAVEDFDGDGVIDLIAAPGWLPVSAWRGTGDLRFEPAASGLPDELVATALGHGDFDGDGDPDLLVATETGLALFWNDAGQWTDGTVAAGVDAVTVEEIVHILVGDLDLDGDLDAWLGSQAGPDTLLVQDAGAFEARVGAFDEPTWTASWLDLAGTLRADLLTTTDTLVLDYGQEPESTEPTGSSDRLYVDGSASDSAADRGLGSPRSSMGALPLDLDDDGHADLLISDFGRNDLLLGAPAGFTPATAAWGLDFPIHQHGPCADGGIGTRNCLVVSWAAHSLDADGDGDRDLLVVNGGIEPPPVGVQPVETWIRDGAGFRPGNAGVAPLQGRGAVLADLDGDRVLDAVVATWQEGVQVWHGLGAPGRRIRLRDRGGRGEGARLTLTWQDGTRETAWIGAGGLPMSAPPAEAWVFGSGRADIEVRWPDGTTTTATLEADTTDRWIEREP